MKKALLIIFILIFANQYVLSAPKKMLPAVQTKDGLPNIFIYTIPDTEFIETDDEEDAKESDYKTQTVEVSEDEPIELDLEDDNTVIGATVLKGYAQYVEDTDVIYLKDDNNNFVLNIKTPQKISGSKGLNLAAELSKKNKWNAKASEYFIAPNNVSTSAKIGNFTIGAQYNNEVDKYAMLETEAGLFTKYERDRFALSTSVAKSLDTTYSKLSDSFSVTPELKLNNYLSLKNTLESNVTYHKHSYKLMLSVNPFGRKEKDRWNFELGAKEVYNAQTETTSSQLLFSTKFKL